MDVRGNLGFMDGLRLMVPVVGKSHSNATSQHDEGVPPSLIQPLELELEALLRDESLRRNRGPANKFQYYDKHCCMLYMYIVWPSTQLDNFHLITSILFTICFGL
jgi:hypothetical protein